jgi:hypothetical protein
MAPNLLYLASVNSPARGIGPRSGVTHPTLSERMHCSKLYDYTPMPHLIFFHGGMLSTGHTSIRNLGRPVSHGCI